jgi:type I site-specific restriction-modification system R (restriction) subunit
VLGTFKATRRTVTPRVLDLCLFINGLPVTTFELKNSLTKQTVDDARRSYVAGSPPLIVQNSSLSAIPASRSCQ